MESIFHEKQQGSLCAQHCLNTLLQGEYFNPVDLAQIASQMDEVERQRMAEGGQHSEEYKKFIQSPSQNMDDSGYFSIQVIEKALKIWNLDMIPYSSSNEIAVQIQQNPIDAQAYICNFRDHWFTIRKFHNQWFNLNSLLSKPQPITDTYLSLFLKQLQIDGYSIFIITGSLPSCQADLDLEKNPIPSSAFGQSTIVETDNNQTSENDITFQKALEMSYLNSLEDENRQLELALKMSMEQDSDGNK